MLRHRVLMTWIGASLVCAILGCDNKPKPKLVTGVTDPLIESKAFRDTVSEVAWVEGLRRMRVRGYGIVVGLGTRGSSECPRQVRRMLLQDMYKMEQFDRAGTDAMPLTPEQLIDDRDTAVVTVEGEIPAAALEGDTFDISVRALSGTQTTSLEGGRLYTCDLRIHQDKSSGSIAGQALATASGPIFVNPWSKSESAATRADPRIGAIMGGGKVEKARRIRLVLEHPSYRRARAVADCINNRFPSHDEIADGQSAAHVKLRIPQAFADNPGRFLDLVRHLYLSTAPGFHDQRAKELAEELLDPQAPHMDIAVAFEGIGRTTLPILRQLYTNDRDHVRFHAGLAGLRLADDAAIEPLAECATNPRSPYRLAAVAAFGGVERMYRPAVILRQLLDDADPRVRVRAYESLLKREDSSVVSMLIGKDRFHLDRISSSAGNVVYAKRTGARRIALLGDSIICRPPLFFCDEDGLITLSAEIGDQNLTLLRKSPYSNRVSPPLRGSFDVRELIPMLGNDPRFGEDGEIDGLALPYSLVVKVLADLCESGAINADFMLEQETVTEMFGPVRESGRGESDL